MTSGESVSASDRTGAASSSAWSEVWSMSALELRQEFRSLRLSPREVATALLERIERLNPRLTAFFTVTGELARDHAAAAEAAYARGETGPALLGIPVSIKDLVATKGIRTTYGSRVYEEYVPDFDAPVVERLRGAGAVLLGKTATSEFGWKAPPGGPLFDWTRNPWDLSRTSAGSSGGAAVAVATGMGPVAIGTDGGGSNRQPASFCGVVGFKATSGIVPTAPRSLADDLEHTGPLARTVRDVALMLDVLAGPDPRDWHSTPREPGTYLDAVEGGVRGLRIAWSSDLGYAVCEPEIAAIAERAARRFEELDCAVEQAHPAWRDPTAMFDALFFDPWGASLQKRLDDWGDRLDPGLRRLIERSGRGSAGDVAWAMEERLAFRDQAQRFFERYDLLLTPTMPLSPFPIGVDVPTEVAGTEVHGMQWTAFTFPFNLTGNPAISVPAGWTEEGLPVGLQIVGPWRGDAAVLRAAAAFEALAGWSGRWPPIALDAGTRPEATG
jgi:aspartyl-tRNA(Asn)/glutamyl-tRNA(Gln) amidotransferase subunit A